MKNCSTLAFLAVAALCALFAGDSAFGASGSPPTFTNPLTITNPLFPFAPNGVKVFEGKKGTGKSTIVDVYLPNTRTIVFNSANVECHIMQETEFVNGLRSEISENYFAQSDDGGVYYCGEIVDVYDTTGAIISHEGSWIVGTPALTDPAGTISQAAPGLRMPMNPPVGATFEPENTPPTLYEKDTIQSITAKVKIPGKTVKNGVQILETGKPVITDEADETKWWVPGIGVVAGKTKGETFQLVATTFIAQ
jgi:hypothetical protein